jgi:hypothetical protein
VPRAVVVFEGVEVVGVVGTEVAGVEEKFREPGRGKIRAL